MNELSLKVFSPHEVDQWNEFVNTSYSGDILQFWQWGETKRTQGWEPLYLGVLHGEELILAALCLLKPVKLLGKYLYIGHGPVFKTVENLQTALPFLLSYLKQNQDELGIFGVEIEPRFGELDAEETDVTRITTNIKAIIDPQIPQILENSGLIRTSRNMQPKYKLYYDLDLTAEKLLSQMKKNTRYNIGLAERKGVVVNEYKANDSELSSKLDQFYDLMLETQKRTGGYPIRSKATFVELFKQFANSETISLFEAQVNSETIAMNISQRTKYWSSSFYAGSNRLFSEAKATYLLRWRSILRAQEFGSKLYDFWGYIPNSKQHQGYSDNKLSFGGVKVNNYGIWAYPLNSFKFKIWSIMINLRGFITKK